MYRVNKRLIYNHRCTHSCTDAGSVNTQRL